MKKRFLSAVALTMALSLTFGMTVFASSNSSIKSDDVTSDSVISESVPAGNVSVSEEEKATLEAESKAVMAVITGVPEGVTVEKLSAAELKDAKAVAAKIAEKSGIANANVNVLAGADLEVDLSATGSFTITLSKAIDPNAKLIVLHLDEATNTWETLRVTIGEDGKTITVYSNSASPFVFAEVKAGKVAGSNDNNDSDPTESPKTGAVASVAGIMAGICLAGAAVSAKKVREEN